MTDDLDDGDLAEAADLILLVQSVYGYRADVTVYTHPERPRTLVAHVGGRTWADYPVAFTVHTVDAQNVGGNDD
jgi:hypothetical protein